MVTRTERHEELPLPVRQIDAVVTGVHEEDEQGGVGDIIRITPFEECTFSHGVQPPIRMSRQDIAVPLDVI